MSMHPTTPEYCLRLFEDVNNTVDTVERLAEQELLSRCEVVSRAFPDRVVTVVGGMGDLFVEISLKEEHNVLKWSPYSFAGEIRYQLMHGSRAVDGPRFLHRLRNYLFEWMEDLEEEVPDLYTTRPMVACGVIEFRNGERKKR